MLGLHRTPKGLGTDLRPKNDETCGYLGVGRQGCMFLLCYSPEYSQYLGPTPHWNQQAPRPLLTIKIGCGTCQFHLLVTQLATGSSFGHKSSQVGHKSLDGLVCHSAWSLIGRKSLLKFLSHPKIGKVRQVTLGGRAQVVGRSLISGKESQVSQMSVASVSRRSGRGCDSRARVHADRLTNGVSQVYHGGRAVVVILGPEVMPIDLRMACDHWELASLSWWAPKSLLLLDQLYSFCLLVCQLRPNIDVNASLRSNNKSLTTAHESMKSRIFQLINRSQVGHDSM